VVTIVTGTTVHHKFNAFKDDGNAFAGTESYSQQQASIERGPIAAAVAQVTTSKDAYGWGPIRTVDW
jgi:hypothetical protein